MSGRPAVASLTRESVSSSGRPMTSAPMMTPLSSRTTTYDARYRSFSYQTSDPECPVDSDDLSPGYTPARSSPRPEVRVVAPDDAAARIDERDERGNVSLEERRVLRAAHEIVADLGRRIAPGRSGGLRERVAGRGLVRDGREPALRPEAVELHPPRRTVDVALRARRELVLVAGRGSHRRPNEQERQQADHGHDQSVDRDDLDSHWPSDPPSYRR